MALFETSDLPTAPQFALAYRCRGLFQAIRSLSTAFGVLNLRAKIFSFSDYTLPRAMCGSRPLRSFPCSLLLAAMLMAATTHGAAADEDDAAIADSLAEMLRSARTVISDSQTRIDDPTLGDKGLNGPVVVKLAAKTYQTATGVDPGSIDPQSRHGKLLRALMDSIAEVMDENQSSINAPGTGFKGFIPAVFARLVTESFGRREQGVAEVKVTAPSNLVRNLKARPDAWEAQVIATKLLQPDWPHGQPFSATVSDGRTAFRVMVPEYYGESCLACHGTPKGEMDKTGYPKEGGKLNDLGAVISIKLYR